MLTLSFPPKPVHQKKPFQSIITNKLNTTTKTINYSKIHNFNPPSIKFHALKNEIQVADDDVEHDQILVASGLQPEMMPKHVAILVDGSRRWAKQRALSANVSQSAVMERIKEITYLCVEYGIDVLTWFTFSTGAWAQPKDDEVENFMELLEGQAMAEMGQLLRCNVRYSVIGDRSALPKSVQKAITIVEDVSKNNSGLHIIMAINYSGRYDIAQACKSVAEKINDGLLQPEDITDNIFEQELETRCTEYPSPDLFIRTSGEHKIDNSMLWQMPYTELFFTEKLFPDFGEADFIEALKSFQKRERCYGGDRKN